MGAARGEAAATSRDALRGNDPHTRRLAGLAAGHVATLEIYRATIAAHLGTVPHVDPLDGGDRATCLLLLETPGPRGDPVRFVSRDNAAGTARNITRFCQAAGLPREHMVLWNVVPWVIHRRGERNRAPGREEIAAGLALLPGLLALLPALRVAVLAGRVAALAAPVVQAGAPRASVLTMPHPSPTYVNTAPEIAGRIVSTLEQAAALALEQCPLLRTCSDQESVARTGT